MNRCLTLPFGMFRFCRLFAALAAVAQVRRSGREKFVGGEVDPAEQLAGVVAGRDAFLFRHAEIVSGDQHLHIAHDLDDGEQPDGDVHVVPLRSGIELPAVSPADALGDPAVGLAAAQRSVAQLCRQRNRFRDLCFQAQMETFFYTNSA